MTDEATIRSIVARRAKASAQADADRLAEMRRKIERQEMYTELRSFIGSQVTIFNDRLREEGVELTINENEIIFSVFVEQISGQFPQQAGAKLTANVADDARFSVEVAHGGGLMRSSQFRAVSNAQNANTPFQSTTPGFDETLRPSHFASFLEHLVTVGLPPEITPP